MFEDLAQQITVRGRVAFALALGERALPMLNMEPNVAGMARNALDTAWQWVAGIDTSPEALDEFLDGDGDDLVILARLHEENETLFCGTNVVVFAVGYAAHHAYQQEDRTEFMSVQVSQCDEHSRMDELFEHLSIALASAGADAEAARAYFQLAHSTTDSSMLGAPIDRGAVLLALQWQ